MSFQSLGNLEKNAKRKLSILCPFNKDPVTAQEELLLVQYLNQMLFRLQWSEYQVKLVTLKKQDERNSKI